MYLLAQNTSEIIGEDNTKLKPKFVCEIIGIILWISLSFTYQL